jgi:hypothetical protein
MPVDVKDRIVLKGTDEVTDDIHMLQAPKALFIPGGLRVHVGHKDEFDLRRGFLARGVDVNKAVEARVPHLCQPEGAAFFSIRVCFFACQQVKECAFPDLWKTNKAQFHRIPSFSTKYPRRFWQTALAGKKPHTNLWNDLWKA